MSTDPTLNCPRCQVHSPFLDFLKDGLGLALPRNHFRCPACGYQWTMEVVEPARVIRFETPFDPMPDVLIIPAKRKPKPIDTPTL
jgi:rubredoxin